MISKFHFTLFVLLGFVNVNVNFSDGFRILIKILGANIENEDVRL